MLRQAPRCAAPAALQACPWDARRKHPHGCAAGTGTGGWESALTNTLSPGDKVVTFRYGLFSHLWIDMMQRLGLDVTVIEGRWGDGAYEDRCAGAPAAWAGTWGP